MRIIAGKWRSRKLRMPNTPLTRPMPDRVKEAVFAMLGAHYDCPGELPAIRVADAFAGSGAMGLESLSRGAAACWFYEQGREALVTLRENLDQLGAGPEACIVAHDAWRKAQRAPDDRPFDLVFLDPPYAHVQMTGKGSRIDGFLVRIAEATDNRPLIVLHHPKKEKTEIDPPGAWRVVERRFFGSNAITFLART